MGRQIHRRTKIAAIGAALLMTAWAAGSAVASGDGDGGARREAAALTGTGRLQRAPGDDVTFTVDAHLAAKDAQDPLKAYGTFRISHYVGDFGGSAEAKVDCLVTGGKVAVVSGVITKADGDVTEAVGNRVGITIHDQGKHDRLGYSWAAIGTPMEQKGLPKCVGSAPFEKIKKGSGDWRVLPWQPEYEKN
jgi:hypothetical protein